VDGSAHAVISPLATWFPDTAALASFRRRDLGRRPALLAPRDRAWRTLTPDFAAARRLAGSGVPFQVVADGRYDRSGDCTRLGRALGGGATVYLPQVHQVLPRLMRLMVALRASLLGPFREETSFLFLVQGRGRPGMGLHHDGDVDAFWLQLAGRRTVTIGPRARPGPSRDIEDRRAQPGGRRWWTGNLAPGTLFYLPPYTPHVVVCHGRSLALSLTWGAPRRRRPASHEAVAAALTAWDVISGRAVPRPRPDRRRLWTQVPVVSGPLERARQQFPLWTPDGVVWLPAAARRLGCDLATMPSLARREARKSQRALGVLLAHGILGDEDLPLQIVPDDPKALDGWRFA
jgi:JmjC domain